jgi:hypothetical protein
MCNACSVSKSNRFKVISTFCLFCDGGHSISADRGCCKTIVISRFWFSDPDFVLVLHWNFCLSLTIHKLLSFFHNAIWFDWVLPFGGVVVNLTPKGPHPKFFLLHNVRRVRCTFSAIKLCGSLLSCWDMMENVLPGDPYSRSQNLGFGDYYSPMEVPWWWHTENTLPGPNRVDWYIICADRAPASAVRLPKRRGKKS